MPAENRRVNSCFRRRVKSKIARPVFDFSVIGRIKHWQKRVDVALCRPIFPILLFDAQIFRDVRENRSRNFPFRLFSPHYVAQLSNDFSYLPSFPFLPRFSILRQGFFRKRERVKFGFFPKLRESQRVVIERRISVLHRITNAIPLNSA